MEQDTNSRSPITGPIPGSRPTPRPYQVAAHGAAWAKFDGGDPSTLVVMPTGTGKTLLAAMMAATAAARGKRTLFLAHREILVSQAAGTLSACGLDVAVEMGSQDAREHGSLLGEPDVVVATVQTMQGRRRERWGRDHFGLIVTDECHRAAAAEHRAIYDWFHAALHLGITATPDGSSGKIGNIFKSWAYHYAMRQAVLDGWLVPPIHEKCKVTIDLRGLGLTAGDYNAADLAERLGPCVSYAADAIKQRVGDRSTVVFTPTVASALAVATALGAESPSGPAMPAGYVAGNAGPFGMARAERRDILDAFERREFQALVCCELLFEGWDARHVAAVVVARPTVLRYRYAQMVGRGTRICPELGKTDCLIVDFDWKADPGARDLVTPIDLVAEDDEDLAKADDAARQAIVADARGIVEQGEHDPMKALERAKEANIRRRGMPIVLAGRRAEFEVERSDPLAVAELAGVKLKQRTEIWTPGAGYERAYDWQVRKLAALGVKEPERLTSFGAFKMIRALERRQKDGLATLAQVREMLRRGVGGMAARTMTTGQASKTIEELRVSLCSRESASTEDPSGR